MKTQQATTKLAAALALNAILFLNPFLLSAAEQPGNADPKVIAPNEPPPVAQSQYGYNADPDELTLARGKYRFVLGDVVFFDSDKTRYIAVPVGYLMDELQSTVPLYLVTQVSKETFLIKQINPEVETVIAARTVKVDTGTPRPL